MRASRSEKYLVGTKAHICLLRRTGSSCTIWCAAILTRPGIVSFTPGRFAALRPVLAARTRIRRLENHDADRWPEGSRVGNARRHRARCPNENRHHAYLAG